MTRARPRTLLLGLAVLSLVASTQASVISPSYVMFYGGQIDAPVVQKLWPGSGSEFLWSPYRAGGTIPDGLEGRPHVRFAIFWGAWNEQPMRPEGASQHGRLYLPTTSEPGVVVMTAAAMDDGTPGRPAARPIPADLAGFASGWAVTSADLGTAKAFGVPGL